MFNLKREIQGAINRTGLAREIEAHVICGCAQRVIGDMLSPAQKNQARVKKYLKSTNTLEIELRNIVVGQRIRNKKEAIISLVNDKMKGEYVKKIRYRLC